MKVLDFSVFGPDDVIVTTELIYVTEIKYFIKVFHSFQVKKIILKIYNQESEYY